MNKVAFLSDSKFCYAQTCVQFTFILFLCLMNFFQKYFQKKICAFVLQDHNLYRQYILYCFAMQCIVCIVCIGCSLCGDSTLHLSCVGEQMWSCPSSHNWRTIQPHETLLWTTTIANVVLPPLEDNLTTRDNAAGNVLAQYISVHHSTSQ